MDLSHRIIFETATDLEVYQVVERIYSGRPARLLYARESDSAQSGIALDNNDQMLFGYNQRLVELIAKIKPKHILLIGGGVYTLPTYLYKHHPSINIDIVEPDSGLEAIAKRYFNFRKPDNSQIFNDRGLHYLKTSGRTYDLIIVDAFSGYEIPDEVLSKKFAKYAANSLKTSGLLAANVISNVTPLSAIGKLFQAYSKNFKYYEVYPAEADGTYFGPTNLIYLGSKNHFKLTLKYPALSGSLFGH